MEKKVEPKEIVIGHEGRVLGRIIFEVPLEEWPEGFAEMELLEFVTMADVFGEG